MNHGVTPIACPGCDLLLKNIAPPKGQKIYCPCCRTQLYKDKTDSVTKVLAISITGLLVYVPATFLPLMTLESFGIYQNGSVYDAFISFYQQKYYFVAVMTFLTSILFPLLKLSVLFTVSLQIKSRRYSNSLPSLLRFVHHLDEWAMPEIYLLGIFIMIIKVYSLADIHFDIGFYSYLILVLATIATSAAYDSRQFWNKIEILKRAVTRHSK